VYSSGLVDILSEETGRALAKLSQDNVEINRGLYRVALWAVSSITKTFATFFQYTSRLSQTQIQTWKEQGKESVRYLNHSLRNQSKWFDEDDDFKLLEDDSDH
jgi:hypothetical protein